MNGFHAFPKKEKAFNGISQVIKNEGLFTGCFYVRDERKFTDFVVKGLYTRKGWFNPPYYTKEDIKTWFSNRFHFNHLENKRSIMYFMSEKIA
jgi:hypothetical protein